MITEDHAGANEEAAPFPAPRCTKSDRRQLDDVLCDEPGDGVIHRL
jgi:hypothetical protein